MSGLNNRVSLERKKELETPDKFMVFLRTAFAKILEYERQITIGLVVFLVGLVAYAGIRYHTDKVSKKAFVRLGQSMSIYTAAAAAEGAVKGFERVESDFKLILEEYPKTVAGKLARINFANICYAAERYDKAISLYEMSLKDYDENHNFRNFVLSGLGYSFEAKKNYNESAKYFEMIISGGDALLKEETLYNLGRVYEQIGEKEKSKNAYKQLISEYADSMYIDVAKESISG